MCLVSCFCCRYKISNGFLDWFRELKSLEEIHEVVQVVEAQHYLAALVVG